MLTSLNHLSNYQHLPAWRVCQSALAMLGSSVFMWIAGATASFADTADLKVSITATIQKHASLKVLTQPLSVVVTAADIVQGYVDVPAQASVQVRSNTKDGYMLMFESQGKFMRQTLVKGLANDIQISSAGGGVAQNTAGRGMRQAQLDLGFRFVLADSALQGTYPWPMRLSVTPL